MADMSLVASHLQRLEAESIHIMREVAATMSKPVMLYSIGKDSAVMLHLARKAFYPSPPPFPLLHGKGGKGIVTIEVFLFRILRLVEPAGCFLHYLVRYLQASPAASR